MTKLFGTDGIRGVANTEPMTAEIALAVGRAAAYHFRNGKKRHVIVIGKDTRLSGYMIESALTAGICSMGVDVLLLGPVPTPGIAFITRDMRADAGIVISASHNPYQDNGIKIFSGQGFKLSDAIERELEDMIHSGRINTIRPTAELIGKAKRIDDAIGRYIVFCKNTFPQNLTLEGLKIVLDCANGATYKVAPTIFSELGAKVKAIHVEPDGTNINDECGALHTATLAKTVLETGADLGLAFDGDGDRLIAVDEKGNELTGDHIIGICARTMKERGELTNNLVVLTPMSNLGLRLTLDKLGIGYEDAEVGDRYVLERMLKHNAVLGGEQSGHVIYRNLHTTGDGIIAALQLLSAMRHSNLPLSALADLFKPAPQKLINIDVRSKPELDSLPGVSDLIRQAELQLGKRGRVLVRYSGTQSICRVMVESDSELVTIGLCESIAGAIRASIGA